MHNAKCRKQLAKTYIGKMQMKHARRKLRKSKNAKMQSKRCKMQTCTYAKLKIKDAQTQNAKRKMQVTNMYK